MAGLTAKDGQVIFNSGSSQAGILRWTLEETAANKTYVSSSTSGWAESAEGAKSWTATIDILFEGGDFPKDQLAALDVGTLLTDVELSVDGTHSRHGPARIDSIGGIEVDIDGSGLVKATITVTGHGALV
jgi:hypothetical protein